MPHIQMGKALAIFRSWQGIYLALGFLIAAGIWAATIYPAKADHPYYNSSNRLVRQWHLPRIHSTTNDENACADDYTSSSTVDDNYVRSRIINTLKYDSTSADWHQGTGDDHLYFTMSSIPCRNLSSTDLEAKELWYRVYDDSQADNACYNLGQGSYQNCADPSGAVTNCTGPNPCHTDYYHYTIVHSYTVIYDNDGTQDSRRRIVNHEVGHALGLGDPKDIDGDGNKEPCIDNSVMHLRDYCPSNSARIWPSADDKDSVNENIYRPYP